MAEFKPALAYVFSNEGEDDPANPDRDDPGGSTAFGITHLALAEHKRRHGSTCPLADTLTVELTRDGAAHVYEHDFWLPQYSALTSQQLATKLFDSTVNLSPYRSTTCLQRALNSAGVVPPLQTDGKFGARTTVACNTVPVELILDKLTVELSKYYVRVTRARLLKKLPEQYRDEIDAAMKYAEGWIARAGRKPKVSQGE